jgi:SulP family sulfate permease
VLKDIIETVQRRGVTVYLSGIRDGHHQPLEALDVITRLAADGHVFATTPEAIAAARRHLHDSGTLPDRTAV